MNSKKLFSAVFAVTFIFIMSAASPKARVADMPLEVGQKLSEMGSLASVRAIAAANEHTLVHFWAAYDGQSRAENVRWNNYLAENVGSALAYVAVSFDTDENIYTQTVRRDALSAKQQIWMPLAERHAAIKRCGLKSAFHTYLLDAEGYVVAVDPSPEDLSQIL